MKSNAANLADAIKKLLTDSQMRKTLGAFGRQEVRRYFSIETMTDKILEVYRQVIKEDK